MATEMAPLVKLSGKLYGITHGLDGTPIVREPRDLKIGIGLAKGKACHAYIDARGKWAVQVGAGQNARVERFEKKEEARAFYREQKRTAPDRQYPQRLSYFVFNRISPDGSFEPDFDVIEQHGPLPTEIDVVFITDDPFRASYQYWTASERRCEGDGLNGMRVLSLAETKAEQDLAAEAQRRGEKYFPIVNGCWTQGCKYSKPSRDQRGREVPSPCRPHGRLLFQLLNSPRLGGTAYYDTTGYRSIQQLFSCIQIIRAWTGQGDPDRGFVAGIPLKMIVRPYRVTFDDRSSTQYAVRLEFRADGAVNLKQRLIEAGVQFRTADRKPLASLDTGSVVELPANGEIAPPENAAAITAEFVEVTEPAETASAVDLARPERPSGSAPETAADRDWDDFLYGQDGDDPVRPPESAEGQEGGKPPVAEPAQPAPKDSFPPPRRASADDVRKFYDLCRTRGLNDSQILAQLGVHGFEKMEEVTDAAINGLMKWAEGLKNVAAGGKK